MPEQTDLVAGSVPKTIEVQAPQIGPEERRIIKAIDGNGHDPDEASRHISEGSAGDRKEIARKESARHIIASLFSVKEGPVDEAEGVDPERVLRLREVFRRITSTPDILIGMPMLPVGTRQEASAMESVWGYEGEQPDKVEPWRPEWNEVDEGQLEEWASGAGFLSLDEVYQGITPAELRQVIDCNPSVSDYFYGEGEFAQEWLKDVRSKLELIRLKVAERLYAQRKFQEARVLLTSILPQLAPQEDTEVHIDATDLNETSGEYLGKIGDKHHVAILSRLKPNWYLNPEDSGDTEAEEDDLMAALHELIHQRQAEIVGPKAMMGADLEDHLSQEEIEKKPARELIQMVRELRIQAFGDDLNLGSAVAEGVATLGELHAMHKEKEGCGDDEARAQVLERMIRDRLSYLRDSGRAIEKGGERRQDYFEGTVRLMRGLYKRFGLQAALSMVADIDLSACNGIRQDNPDYQRMLNDPRLLPGLDRNPQVKKSLLEDPPK